METHAFDHYRFLDPWTLLLPQEGPCVLAVAGSGGKTTLIHRLHSFYRAREANVLWTQTVSHPAPVAVPVATGSESDLAERLKREGTLYVAGPDDGEGRPGGLTPAEVAGLATRSQADVVLVECHSRTQTPLRQDGVGPVWPQQCDRAFLTANLAAVGRPRGPQVVAGVAPVPREAGQPPERVSIDDVIHTFAAGLLGDLPDRGLVIPFLTGFGAFRDLDGMFSVVERLWSSPRVRAVCLAELLGESRRDAADLRDLGAGAPALTGERVYAVYPAELDGE